MARDEVAFMKSQNFEFLRARRGVLADLAGAAEAYAHSDPPASLLKQRQFVEVVVAANHLFDALVQRAFTGELTSSKASTRPIQTSLFAEGA